MLNKVEQKIKKQRLDINRIEKLIKTVKCPYVRLYYKDLLKKEKFKLSHLTQYLNDETETDTDTHNPNTFTYEELKKYDGVNNPAYVSVNGIVYDVSNQSTWGGSTHFGLYAGKDLTEQFASCHGNPDILKNLPKVGAIKE